MNWKRFAFDYAMLFVLLGLCLFFSAAKTQDQYPTGARAARAVAEQILERGGEADVLLVARDAQEHLEFADALEAALHGKAAGVERVTGGPQETARALRRRIAADDLPGVIAGPPASIKTVRDFLANPDFAGLQGVPLVGPKPVRWPVFLTRQNLMNVAAQIVVIAIIAIGMTLVILTAGIDLSSGSLVAMSGAMAVAIIWGVMPEGDSGEAGWLLVVAACGASLLACALIGLATGVLVACFDVPAFIVTLSTMMVARGLAYKVTGGEALGNVPASFTWLGQADIAGLPVSVLIMLLLFALAWLLLTHTALGRYIYAVGGNPEAARLSGVPVRAVLVFVYTVSALLAGLGGLIEASELTSGDPKTGGFYELYVIAAVVVGGTSLMGGEGRILGTLIGAFIIGVIRNGMNLLNVNAYNQYIVFGAIILLAVLLERLKKHVWKEYA